MQPATTAVNQVARQVANTLAVTIPATVVFDAIARMWTVQTRIRSQRHELLIPNTAGEPFSTWRNGWYVGPLDARLGETTPAEVASRFLAVVSPAT